MKIKFILVLSIILIWSCSDNKTNSEENKNTTSISVDEEHPSIHQQELEKHNNNKKTNNYTESSMLVEVVSEENITKDLNQRFTSPVFTLDGTKIIFTTENYIGIWVYDILQKTVQQMQPNCYYIILLMFLP